MVELLSHKIFVASFASIPRCSMIRLSQIHWHAQYAAAIYLASVVDKLTTGYFFEAQDTVVVPIINTDPVVLLLSSGSPA